MKYDLISAGTEKAQLIGGNNTKKSFPFNVGYSSTGHVAKIGNGVSTLSVGDRVFVPNGGHSNTVIKHKSSVYKIPDNVSMEEAVFTKVASFPLAAIRRSRLEIGESIVIVGLGMLGLFAVQFAHIGGATPIIAIGNRDVRKQKAKEYGAEYILNPDSDTLTEDVFKITETETRIKGANVIIETSGSEQGLLQCLKYTSKHARVMLNGCQRVMTQPVNFYKYVHLRGVNIIGVHDFTCAAYNSMPGNWTHTRDYITILQLLSKGRLESKSMISELVSPNDALKTYNRLLYDRNFPLGVIFDWDKYQDV